MIREYWAFAAVLILAALTGDWRVVIIVGAVTAAALLSSVPVVARVAWVRVLFPPGSLLNQREGGRNPQPAQPIRLRPRPEPPEIVFICDACGGPLDLQGDMFQCLRCGHEQAEATSQTQPPVPAR